MIKIKDTGNSTKVEMAFNTEEQMVHEISAFCKSIINNDDTIDVFLLALDVAIKEKAARASH